MIRRFSRTVWAMELLGLAPTTAIDRGENSGPRSIGARGAVTRRLGPSPDDRADAALLEGARDDQPLDLAGPLPEPVDAELAQEPLGRKLAHVAAAAEDLDDAVGAALG